MSRVVEVTDVILRDAHQSLLATRMAMEDMLPALSDLDAAGYWSLECWGGATFDSCIRFLNEDPWQRLRTFREHLPRTRLQMLLRGQNLLGYRHYGDDVVRRFVARAAANGMDVFRVFDALNDLRNLATAIAAVKAEDKHAQGTICYTVSPIHTIAAFVDQARRLQDLGVDSICIKDMAALLKPQAAYDLVRGIKEACGDELLVHLHVHATTGVTMVSLMKAVEAGVDIVDTAVSSLSLGTGHNPTEAFCEMLEGTGFTTRIDLERVERVKRHFAAIKPRYREFMTSFDGVETSIFNSQIPGGMLSNMESQLKQQGAGHRMDEVLAEVPAVRADAGYPPLVTPSSQIVGTQAVLNVLMGRYTRMTSEFQDLMLGYYGETIGDKNPEVIAIAEGQAGKGVITERPADAISDEFEELGSAARACDGCDGSDEDVLTYALFPKVAPGFFATRKDGPRNLGRDPDAPASTSPAPVSAAPSPAATGGKRDYRISVNGTSYAVSVEPGSAPAITREVAPAPAPVEPENGEAVHADLSGNVWKLLKKPGDTVAADEAILILEAMKMETEVSAPRAGTLLDYAVKEGESVAVGDVLAWLA